MVIHRNVIYYCIIVIVGCHGNKTIETSISTALSAWESIRSPTTAGCSVQFNKINFLEAIQQKCYLQGRPSDPPIHVAVVACGGDDRVEETIVNIKALVLFSTIHIAFHVFADEGLQPRFRVRIKKWPSYFRRQFTYTIYNITYPEDGQQENWRRLFKPCASQRLFLPSILQDVDSILYVDTDILFLSPVEEMWGEFDKFNSTQLSALSPEHEDPRVGWYSRFARHPYYGVTGVNSGVMLMNLTRIRNAEFKSDLQESTMRWQQMLLPLYVKYSLNLTWGDQDLLNIIFHYNPEMLRMMPCNKNYRPDHCMYMQMCASTAHEGVRVMHGCRRSFHIDKWPTFRSVYAVVRDFNLCSPLPTLVQKVKDGLSRGPDTQCKLSSDVILRGLRRTIHGLL